MDETGGSWMPFSPGTLVALLTIPTFVLPESEATGFSPGAACSLCAGALSAPRPCAAVGICQLQANGY